MGWQKRKRGVISRRWDKRPMGKKRSGEGGEVDDKKDGVRDKPIG